MAAHVDPVRVNDAASIYLCLSSLAVVEVVNGYAACCRRLLSLRHSLSTDGHGMLMLKQSQAFKPERVRPARPYFLSVHFTLFSTDVLLQEPCPCATGQEMKRMHACTKLEQPAHINCMRSCTKDRLLS